MYYLVQVVYGLYVHIISLLSKIVESLMIKDGGKQVGVFSVYT